MVNQANKTTGEIRLLVALSIFCLTVGILLTVQSMIQLTTTVDEIGSQEMSVVIASMVEQAIEADAKNIHNARNRMASAQTAMFIEQNMRMVTAVKDAQTLLDLSLQAVDWSAQGHNAEFGVYSGTTVNYIARKIDEKIHGFDSFEGLPEDWRTGFRKGMFAMDGLPVVEKNVELHKGWFDAVLPDWKTAHPGQMKFIHMDADLYSSTKTVLDELSKQIVRGTVIQFDEFFNYPGWRYGEYMAFMEYVEEHGVSFEYLGYAAGGTAQQVSIRILNVSNP